MSTKNQTTTEDVREAFVQSHRWPDGSANRGARKGALVAFGRWLAAHEADLREQVAAEIEAEADKDQGIVAPDFYSGLDFAADIARGTTRQEHS